MLIYLIKLISKKKNYNSLVTKPNLLINKNNILSFNLFLFILNFYIL